MNKIKIKISNNAYKDLVNLFKFHDEYNCVKLKYEDGCCKSSKVQLILDRLNPMDNQDKIENLIFSYDNEILDKVEEILIVLKNGSYLIKSKVKDNSSSNNCNSCSKSCSGHCSHNKSTT
jgi:hypothetical protein